jgi:shikimate dehydrogenase
MHNTAANYYNLPVRYYAIRVDAKDLPSLALWLHQEQLLGINVTIPHKQTMLQYVDTVADSCKNIGALNTVVKREGSLVGHNTDIDGFCKPLYSFQSGLKGECAVVFGTGGAARAVVYGLKRLNLRRIVLVSRHPSDKMDQNWPGGTSIVSYDEWQSYAREAVLFANTTPLGMDPDTGNSPIKEPEKHLLSDKICYDIVYNPLKTTFLRRAEEAGASTISGLEMFIQQGSRSFELWTGKSFPVDRVRKELINVLRDGS